MLAVCPITAQRVAPRYPNEVPIPVGIGGQTRPGVILCHQVRTISMHRVRAPVRSHGSLAYVTDPEIRASVRRSLAHHLGLDIPSVDDGATGADVFAS